MLSMIFVGLSVPPPGPPSPDQGQLYIGRFRYAARTQEDLSFEKGEKLSVTGGTEGDWWFAKSTLTGKEGYIPRNYVAPVKSFEAEE